MAKGGKQPGSGRPKGSLNKATADVKEAARKHGPAAIDTLALLMRSADSDSSKIAAAKELLDRAYGKATQPIANEEGKAFILQMIERRIVNTDNRDR